MKNSNAHSNAKRTYRMTRVNTNPRNRSEILDLAYLLPNESDQEFVKNFIIQELDRPRPCTIHPFLIMYQATLNERSIPKRRKLVSVLTETLKERNVVYNAYDRRSQTKSSSSR